MQKRHSAAQSTLKARPTKPMPARRPPANKWKIYPAEILTGDEARRLIKACSNRAPTGIRNQALLVLLYRGGLRVSEALRLAPKDVDPDAGTLTVLRGKGGKRRTTGLDPGAFPVLERWLDRRAALGINGRAPLLCTLKGKPLATQYVRTLLPRLARRARIARPRSEFDFNGITGRDLPQSRSCTALDTPATYVPTPWDASCDAACRMGRRA
jgi:site-specific recombinase XerD